ncbi:winged helix-turn-helix domain-containing protein [Methanococcoides burtonii]|nr:winged helix-turn-helix domain-containing protein [Methanococcoides burtonii]
MDLDENNRKKQKLIEQMKEAGKKRNPSEDHAVALKILQNPTRRKIIEFMKDGPKSLDQIKDKYDLNNMQARLNLDMLEDSFYIAKTDSSDKINYELTIRGDAFLENVRTGGK